VHENIPLLLGTLVCTGLAWPFPLVALGSAAIAMIGPLGLSVRGRTSRLALTRRLKTLAVTSGAIEAGIGVVGVAVGQVAFFAALGVTLTPVVVDASAALTEPLERWLASRHVARAARRLQSVDPTIVGITGSYGKTSTKNYVAHLVGGSRRVVASPASFNNRAGLARAVNEHLVEGTEVFVAEMGTYGRGEIAELCSWCPPEIALITAIGPVHLERFGSEDAIVEAKSEIAQTASVIVLNIDDERLAKLAGVLAARYDRPVVIGCSSRDREADVFVGAGLGGFEVVIDGTPLGTVTVTPGAHPTNLACAVAVSKQLGVSPQEVLGRLADLPTVAHRAALATAPSGVRIVDDTFNSNPVGARAALEVLCQASGNGRRAVVTPGMVELGPRQFEENCLFAQAVVKSGSDLVVVGRTNRAALAAGAGRNGVVRLRTREDAVRWVRQHLSRGDAVLYENDLPDHYP
jgi:UDP-N-acetylmuramoyl-tripeptide--D-alanyl-D-alanine ligase